MTDDNGLIQESIRLVFELERADNPRLYDDLNQFKKGSKRVNRLRTLAHEGLLAQHWLVTGGGYPVPPEIDAAYIKTVGAPITNQLFEEPILE